MSTILGCGGGTPYIEVAWSTTLLAAGFLPVGESINTTGCSAIQLRAEIELSCLAFIIVVSRAEPRFKRVDWIDEESISY